MDHKVWMYLVYLVVSVGLTVWVATTLSRNGLVFLADVFADSKLARAVNHLLVMGFYLLNLGYVAVAMRSSAVVPDASRALETLSLKIGLVLLVLGVLHFLNVYFLNHYRRGRLRQQQTQPPLPPAGRLPHPPPGGSWPSHPAVPGLQPGPQQGADVQPGPSAPQHGTRIQPGPSAPPRPGMAPPPTPA